jgi:hypothetical protein
MLIALYAFGAWVRSFFAPPPGKPLAIRRQLIASFPVGLITAGIYAKSAFPALTLASRGLTGDIALMAGNVMVLGMLSREALDRMLKAAHLDGRGESGGSSDA